ncbi:MAG: hypothetical protein ACRED9_03010 [Caulobacteraceae bacterium]
MKVQRLGLAVSALMGTQVPQTLTETWAATALPHQVGFADGGGWAGNTSTAQGHLTYGPYVTTVSNGSHVAVWQLMIDNNTQPDGLDMVRLEVNDATAGYELAARSLTREAWTATMTYQEFGVPFTLPAGHAGDELEFRTLFYPYSYIRVGEVGYQ